MLQLGDIGLDDQLQDNQVTGSHDGSHDNIEQHIGAPVDFRTSQLLDIVQDQQLSTLEGQDRLCNTHDAKQADEVVMPDAVCLGDTENIHHVQCDRPDNQNSSGRGNDNRNQVRGDINSSQEQVGTAVDDLTGQAPLCDVLTFHTPLTRGGEYPTYHLCDANILRLCKPGTLIINAARGGIIDEQALLSTLNTKHSTLNYKTAIDCWENEPNVNLELLKHVDLASFHIAGYSIQGKMNASEMCLRAFCEFFSLPILSINKKVVPLQGDSEPGWLKRISAQLKASPEHFEQLRKQYKLR